METSIVKLNVCGYALYYLDSPKIEHANTPAPMMAAEGPFEIAYIHPNDTFERATHVIVQITSDRTDANGVFVGRVIYVWAVDTAKDTATGDIQLSNATKMELADDINVSHVSVTAVIDDKGFNVPEYNIQLRSRHSPIAPATTTCTGRKKLTKIKRK
ncbi:hypothetical protein F-S17_0254 [Faustovirus]|nr:hypothetical protein F-S17_0254 [Faustovirus]